MQELYDRLTMDNEAGTLDPEEEKLAKKLFKTLVLLASDPRHNSLQSHEIDALTRRVGFKVFQSYLENRNPSAGRLFWAYGPGRGQITVLGAAGARGSWVRWLKNRPENRIFHGLESLAYPDPNLVEVSRGWA